MITLTLEGQNLSVSTPHVVAGTKDYLSVEIVRGKEWKDLSLHIFFQLGSKTYELITDGDFIGPSAHINLSAGLWAVSASGYEYEGDELVMKITTNAIGLSVAPPPPESGDDLPYIPPTSMEQIAAIAQSVRDDADSGAFDGNGISGVELNDDYTLTITFTDGSSETFGPIRGEQGEKGDTGDTGAPGATGAQGPQGEQGVRGEQGIQGPQGVQGPTGATGNGISSVVMNDDYTLSIWLTDGTIYTTPSLRGEQGVQGEKGERGPRGYIGPEGPEGPQGETGPQGPAGPKGSIFFGQVDDTSTATEFTAQIPGITEYFDGLMILLQNGVVTSASGFTIDINGIGDKAVYNNMATGNPITPTAPSRETTIFNINYTMLFVYSSTIVEDGAWICYRGYDSNQNTIGYQLRTSSYSLPASDKFYRNRLLFTSADNTKFVPANKSSSTNATASRTTNTTPIDPFGPIVYYASTTAIEANAKPGATALWQQYTLSLGYSFNNTDAALVMTTSKPVYLKCTPQADGSAVMDYFTQALPSTEDGKIYILLGYAYSATNIELIANHPVYYYKNGGVRLWTGA